ncbi:MAG: hypothetical protein QF436_00920 [Candidatus Woesearchaeota archaeon]|jgi:hypothetical protein|nr:hypothetical protein [Candidatus Woesearchaeota archaeon]MDP7622657.1 hypothetical protein [Candidatus Woesearchaeota archaeon]HJN57256.1 hypothetical protein [Candidatus Woesearchaeota archaeon]|tara:strand:- start:9023 stop:9949 length:927 start_codon:yes stop_codon:yes gene_type:complete
MNKKGVFFTFAAIALSVIIIMSFNTYKSYDMKEKTDVVGVRINTVNNFIKDIEQDLEKGLFIAGFRAFLSMGESIANKGTFITNLEGSFEELVLQGTLNNEELSLMKDSTFTDWSEKIEAQANKVGITVNFTILSVSITQEDAWSVLVNANLSLEVRDEKNTSSWKRNKSMVAEISTESFEDPLYTLNSQGRVISAITKSPITDFTDEGDVSNLLEFINNSYYIESNTSPNFLMRLQGILSNSSTGIESLVNLEEFQEQGLAIKDRSAVDYIYFGTQSTSNYRINNTPEWFKLDNGHLEIYKVQNITI